MKKLITKATVKILFFAVISALLAAVKDSAILTNNIALGQMENSNEAYILMQFIQNLNSVVTFLYIIFAVLIFWPVVVDIYKFIKMKYSKEETKE